MRIPACFEDKDTRQIIDGLCKTNRIDFQLLVDLCETIQKYSGSGRKEGVTSDIAACIDAYLQRDQTTK
jgi:hypothetical protein